MSESTIPAVVDALLAHVRTASLLTTIPVRYGYVDPTKCTEFVQFTEIRFDQEQQAMGMDNREEDFTITGTIATRRPGAGESVAFEVMERAFNLFDAIEAVLIAEFAISGVNLKYGEITKGLYTPGLDDRGITGQLDFTVHFIADLG